MLENFFFTKFKFEKDIWVIDILLVIKSFQF